MTGSMMLTSTFGLSVSGLLRLQQIYQGLQPGSELFRVDVVRRISNVSQALDFIHALEVIDR